MRKNPILQKELKTGARSIRMSWAVLGVNVALGLIVFFNFLSIESDIGGGYAYDRVVRLFPILAAMECVLLSLLVPIMTSGSISGERERQTLDLMLTTPMKPMAIIFGKLQATMAVVLMYLISSIPVLSVPLLFGGISWWKLVEFLLLLFYIGMYVGSVGIFCSSLVKKSVISSIITMTIGIGIIIVTIVGFSLTVSAKVDAVVAGSGHANLGAAGFWLVLNPYAPFFDFFPEMLYGTGMAEIMADTGKSILILEKLYPVWIPFTVVCNLIIAYVFLRIAAMRLNPGEKRKQK
ncbi:MAG: ABC transporter permease [Lachnospiraceae bacterium]